MMLSFMVASSLELPVHKLEKLGLRRKFATLLTLFLSIIITGSLLMIITLLVSKEITELLSHINTYGGELSRFLAKLNIDVDKVKINDLIMSGREQLIDYIKNHGESLTGVIVDMTIILFFSYYFVTDSIKLRKSMLKFFDVKRQEMLLNIWQIVIEKTGSYLITRLILILISSASMGLFLTIIHVPYGWALGVWFGFISQALPIIGTYVGLSFPLLVSFNHGTALGVLVIIYVILFQLIADYILLPRLASESLELHPAIIFASVLIGGATLGLSGILIAIPVAATIRSVITTYMHKDEIEIDHSLLNEYKKEKDFKKKKSKKKRKRN